jgi:hypothetical protein
MLLDNIINFLTFIDSKMEKIPHNNIKSSFQLNNLIQDIKNNLEFRDELLKRLPSYFNMRKPLNKKENIIAFKN